MAADVGLSKLPPRNKATVMILGNHSSGKSSFINCIVSFFCVHLQGILKRTFFLQELLWRVVDLHLFPRVQKRRLL